MHGNIIFYGDTKMSLIQYIKKYYNGQVITPQNMNKICDDQSNIEILSNEKLGNIIRKIEKMAKRIVEDQIINIKFEQNDFITNTIQSLEKSDDTLSLSIGA